MHTRAETQVKCLQIKKQTNKNRLRRACVLNTSGHINQRLKYEKEKKQNESGF